VGGGLGDIEEVLAAGRGLAGRPGIRLLLFRGPGRPLPAHVDGPWEWPPLERVDRPAMGAPRALTVSAEWGVSAAPERPGPYGRAGPWAWESEAVERSYGADSVVHVSLEEFARTLTSLQESSERYREGGVPIRSIPARLASSQGRAERERFRSAYRTFRGFDRPNLLSVFSTFRPSRRFALEYPEAIQTGPLWPGASPGGRRTLHSPPEWLWYASPSSSVELIPGIDRALGRIPDPPKVLVRSPRPLPLPTGPRWTPVATEDSGAWRARFASAALRIVTGSRTLLEALEVGGPFLYYNGVIGRGPSRRRHRPEKIVALLEAWRADGVGVAVADDLRSFACGRAVERIVRRAARDPAFSDGFPSGWRPRGFPSPFDDAGRFLDRVAEGWAGGGEDADTFVAGLRREARTALGLEAGPSEL